jgi:hypothetical protein
LVESLDEDCTGEGAEQYAYGDLLAEDAPLADNFVAHVVPLDAQAHRYRVTVSREAHDRGNARPRRVISSKPWK